MEGQAPVDSDRSGDAEEAEVKRYFTIGLLILTLGMIALAEEPLDKQRAKADSAKPGDCAKICIKVAQRLAEISNSQFEAGTVEVAQKTMQDAIAYAERGANGAIESHKHQKDADIELRKLAKRMRDIAESLSVDDRQPILDGVKKIEKLRDQVLTAMFGNPPSSFQEKKK